MESHHPCRVVITTGITTAFLLKNLVNKILYLYRVSALHGYHGVDWSVNYLLYTDESTTACTDPEKEDALNKEIVKCFNLQLPPVAPNRPQSLQPCPENFLCSEEEVTALLILILQEHAASMVFEEERSKQQQSEQVRMNFFRVCSA